MCYRNLGAICTKECAPPSHVNLEKNICSPLFAAGCQDCEGLLNNCRGFVEDLSNISPSVKDWDSTPPSLLERSFCRIQGGNMMHARALDYAMHNYAGCISKKTQGDCKQEGLRSPKNRQYSKVTNSHSYAVCSEASLNITIAHQHLGTIISANLLSFGSRRDTTFFLIFTRWKNSIVLQSIFSSANMCRCILVDKIVHDKEHNNELHWTRVKQNIMHD